MKGSSRISEAQREPLVGGKRKQRITELVLELPDEILYVQIKLVQAGETVNFAKSGQVACSFACKCISRLPIRVVPRNRSFFASKW